VKRFTCALKDSETRSDMKAVTIGNGIDNGNFYSAFFNMEKWWLVAANIGKKRGPYIFIDESEGTKSLLIFTSAKKASYFTKDNKIATNENGEYVIAKKPLSIITSIGGYKELGIERIIIDLCWRLELEQLRNLYFHFIKDYNFKAIIENINREFSPISIGELWTMIFHLPAWYFIGNIEEGIVYGNTVNSDKVIFLFLSFREAIKTINEINKRVVNQNYKIYKYKPEEGYEFLLFMHNEADVNGLVLRDKDIYNGTRIENVVKVKDIFEI
jgi:hypothetical protein